MTLEELLQELEDYDARGFERYMNPIDRDVAHDICETCGGETYGRGRAKRMGGKLIEYHCWVCCDYCDKADEF